MSENEGRCGRVASLCRPRMGRALHKFKEDRSLYRTYIMCTVFYWKSRSDIYHHNIEKGETKTQQYFDPGDSTYNSRKKVTREHYVSDSSGEKYYFRWLLDDF